MKRVENVRVVNTTNGALIVTLMPSNCVSIAPVENPTTNKVVLKRSEVAFIAAEFFDADVSYVYNLEFDGRHLLRYERDANDERRLIIFNSGSNDSIAITKVDDSNDSIVITQVEYDSIYYFVFPEEIEDENIPASS